MFDMKGVRKITPDERTFALCFARTMSVRESCSAAGFWPQTSFARASRLLERDDVRSFVRASILDASSGFFPVGSVCPAPADSVDEAAGADVAPVSLENVRDARADSGGRVNKPVADGSTPSGGDPLCPSESGRSIVPPFRDTGVPAPNAKREASESVDASSLESVERRILSEYEKIAFAEATKDSVVKPADKLRALEQYRAIVEKQSRRLADAAEAERLAQCADDERLTVIYDYGDERETT